MELINQHKARALLHLTAKARASVLLVGPPGHGKTELARYYLSQFARQPLLINAGEGQVIEKIKSTSNLAIIIDEVHRMRPGEPEALYPILDAPRSWWKPKPIFAMATTDQGDLPPAFVSRLWVVALEKYTLEDLALIARQVASHLSQEALLELARCAHGSPRRVKMLANMIKQVRGPVQVSTFLSSIGYANGFNAQEMAFLETLSQGPRSIATISGMMGVGTNTVKALEREFIAAGLVEITSKGRTLTPQGYAYVKGRPLDYDLGRLVGL